VVLRLQDILSYPPTRSLSPAESDLLWSFRFYLTRFPAGLTKFLKSVSWTDAGEAKQATEVLMPMWSEIGMDDALELLGPGFKDARVKAYAVKTIEKADDEELLLYLLQLVQALKFDVASPLTASSRKDQNSPAISTSINTFESPSSSAGPSSTGPLQEGGGLADFLIRRASKNAVLANNLYWYLEVECEDRKVGKMFRRVRTVYLDRLAKSDHRHELRETFKRQSELLQILSSRAKELRVSKDARPKKIDKMRLYINDAKNGLLHFNPPLPLPLDARILVTGIRAEKSSIFKSNLFPLLLHFDTPDENVSYSVIFKNGDDMRQDQLVIQLFTLMDRLLRNENLDLCITPYKVLATGTSDGMVQYIESTTLASILQQHQNSLQNYMRSHFPDQSDDAVYGIKSSVFETYLRSCAGYCVVTYLLGVGDRHLDNLLLSPDGHFFHVDFGYILNRDPKPFAPAVKLSKEMVDAMGGTTSPHYTRFKKFCFTAFITLRKSSNLILNLINLMIDANVTDVRFEPDKAVVKVQEKFKLDLSDEQAIQFFEEMLNEPSYMTLMFDRLHGAAQFFRS
jgi:phosphatidylinositol 3-kinase